MTSKKISELDKLSTATGDELIPVVFETNNKTLDVAAIGDYIFNTYLSEMSADIRNLKDSLSAFTSASSQFGTDTAQAINKVNQGFGNISWDNIKLNSNPDIVEVVANEIIIKREGTYQFTTNLALKRTSVSAQSELLFQFFMDGEPLNGEFHESIYLQYGHVTYLPMTTILEVPEGKTGTLTVGIKLGGDANVQIHSFTSIMNATHICSGH